jgi:cation diffusion facilitator CzcD-associated flavoprotein CzcO
LIPGRHCKPAYSHVTITMAFPAKRVAVIGAGVSGLTSARHLKAAGLDVVVYERSSASGGIWFEEPAILPSYQC